MGKYELLDKESKKVKEIDSSCYTRALETFLDGLGFIVESVDDPSMYHKQVVASQSGVIPTTETMPQVQKQTSTLEPHPSFTSSTLGIFNMLKEGEYTLAELALKFKISEGTVKNYVCNVFKSKGYIVEGNNFPGRGITYKIKGKI